MHNMKHDQQACRRRKALKIEHAHSPFRVFHNYSSSLRGALRVLPNLTTKEKHTMCELLGHMLPLLNPLRGFIF